MLQNKAKILTDKLLAPFLDKPNDLSWHDVQPALDYIQAYWHKLERFHPKDEDNLVGLPHPFLVPSIEEGHEFDYNELYYWDSYFMVQCMLDEQHKELVIGILENLVYMFNRFKIIPNGSRLYYVSRSQPPFLTSFIWDVYETYKLDKKWLARMMETAVAEYNIVWMGTRKPNVRQVYRGLSRYYDFNYLHDIAEAESGWDMTPRFARRALNYLPVDLNTLLYKYEKDFVRYYELIGDTKEAAKWEGAANLRKSTIDSIMWSNSKGLYFDYNFVKEKRGNVSSLAAYFPLWTGMADEQQAAKLVKSLKKFEEKGGLATTDPEPLSVLAPGGIAVPGTATFPTQWAHPNGWAPLQFLVVMGLERYGYHEDARRIALKWLRANLDWFNEHGLFLEKYNVVDPTKPPAKGLYPSQTGFGWTNAVFTVFAKKYLPE